MYTAKGEKRKKPAWHSSMQPSMESFWPIWKRSFFLLSDFSFGFSSLAYLRQAPISLADWNTHFAITTSFTMVNLGHVFVTDKLGISITRCRSCIKEFRLQWRICDNKQRTMSIKIQMECVLMGEHTMLLAVYFDVRKCHSPHFMMTPGPAPWARAFLATFCIHFASISLYFCDALRVFGIECGRYKKLCIQSIHPTHRANNTIFCENFFIALPASEGAILLKCWVVELNTRKIAVTSSEPTRGRGKC